MKNIFTYLILYLITLGTSSLSLDQINGEIKLISSKTNFIAGEDIVLTFSSSNKSEPHLYFSNSYGSSLVTPTKQGDVLSYDLTKDLNHISGVVNWTLILNNEDNIEGMLTIIPAERITQIESYLGPNTIQAGEKDFAMMVLLLHDKFDNPAADSTKATFKSQFLNDESSTQINSSNLISFKNIYAKKEIGRILLSAESGKTYAKEYTVDVLPNIPTNFIISAKRNHAYSDGNQLTTFSSSVIRDEYQNIVSNGTYVDFFIKNREGHTLKTSGTTVNGIAVANMIHPNKPDEWKIKAFIPGMAESNELTLVYKNAIKEFQISFNEEYNTLDVLGLKSFMNQFIPDGQQVTLKIIKNKKLLNTIQETSKNGEVRFKLKDRLTSKGSYSIVVQVAGLSKTIEHIHK